MLDVVARTAVAAVAATIANVLLRTLAVAVFDIPDAFEHLEVRAVVISTLVGVIGAGIVYAVVRATSSDPDRVFTAIAILVLALSLAAPIGVALNPPDYPGTGVGSIGTMLLMHVVTAVIAITALTRR